MQTTEQEVKKVVIFIDLPNLIHSADQFGYEVNKFLDLTKQYGEIQEGYAYFDFTKDRVPLSIQHILVSQNIKIIQCPSNTIKRETKIDDLMLIEGIHDSLRKNADVFYVLVTSDSMIIPVSLTLRSLSKDFRIYGFSENTSDLLKLMPEFIALSKFLKKKNINFPVQKKETYGKVAC